MHLKRQPEYSDDNRLKAVGLRQHHYAPDAWLRQNLFPVSQERGILPTRKATLLKSGQKTTPTGGGEPVGVMGGVNDREEKIANRSRRVWEEESATPKL